MTPNQKDGSLDEALGIDELDVPEIRNADRNESQTVMRACQVLKAFRYLGEELQLSDVMDRTGLPKTTTFRLLRTLIHGGLIERASAGVYRNNIGPVTARPFRTGFAAGAPQRARKHR